MLPTAFEAVLKNGYNGSICTPSIFEDKKSSRARKAVIRSQGNEVSTTQHLLQNEVQIRLRLTRKLYGKSSVRPYHAAMGRVPKRAECGLPKGD